MRFIVFRSIQERMFMLFACHHLAPQMLQMFLIFHDFHPFSMKKTIVTMHHQVLSRFTSLLVYA